jgi:coiled-coil domain-containing protein 55
LFFPFKVKEQQKKALDEYPTIFDYDGVYDRMKEKVAHPLIQDGEERGMVAALSNLIIDSLMTYVEGQLKCCS